MRPSSLLGHGSGAPLAYVPELDGLRALAIAAVLLNHTMPRYFPGGFIGVDVFFVLSGYLITTILCREFASQRRVRLGHFYLRRSVRLMPALYTMLAAYVLFVVVLKLGVAVDRPVHDHLQAVLSSALYLMNWTSAFGLGPGSFLLHTWSLGIEEQFYLLWPPILVALLRRKLGPGTWKLVLALILVTVAWRTILVSHHAHPARIHGAFDTRMDTLLVGCLLALTHLDRVQPLAARFSFCPVLALLVMIFTLDWTSPLLYLLGFPLISLCAAWILLASLPIGADGVLRRFLRSPPLIHCGKISYGFYLWHYPIAGMVALYFTGVRFGAPKTFLVTAILTLVAASLSYRLVERPLLLRVARGGPDAHLQQALPHPPLPASDTALTRAL